MRSLFAGVLFLWLWGLQNVNAQCFLPPLTHPCQVKHHFSSPPPPTIDTRSDSIALLHFDISANFSPLSAQTLSQGRCDITFTPLVNAVPSIRLDLLDLIVSEVKLNGQIIPFSYNSPSLQIDFDNDILFGDTSILSVLYSGAPAQDNQWGGFYFSGAYGFNLGVAFQAAPHNFGRVWFPCFDNFVTRSSYKFNIITQADRPAFCNGTLVADTLLSATERLRIWDMPVPIPTYLACVAMGPYISWERTYLGQTGSIPVQIAVAASDSTDLAASFIHLPDALECYEHWFGPYRWNKIGYSVVPFSGGAMEHATNIAYPLFAVEGSTNYEYLMGHEFSHHWWGDLATCSTAEDMWLNEGWAVYSEHLLNEWLYGETSFKNAVQANHLSVLQNAHVAEGGYLAVSGIPHEITYGQHVYNKGAVVAHNLRGYLGDSLFQIGLQACMEAKAFQDWSSADFRDQLIAATNVDLTPFFEAWVFNGGYSHFEVVDFEVQFFESQYLVNVEIAQKRRGAPDFHQQVPLDITFVAADQTRLTQRATAGGQNTTAVFNLPFAPVQIYANEHQSLNLAHAIVFKEIVNAVTNTFSTTKCTIKALVAPSDTVFMRTEYHYVFPDTVNCNSYGYKFSNRYWSIDGFWPTDFDATFSVFYDGGGQLDQLDTELFANSSQEDSVMLVYRSSAQANWEEVNDYQHSMLSNTSDAFGSLRANHLKKGQYAIVKGIKGLVGTKEVVAEVGVLLSPNPSQGHVEIQCEENMDLLQFYGAHGQLLLEVLPNTQNYKADISQFPIGTYNLLVFTKSGVALQKVLKQ